MAIDRATVTAVSVEKTPSVATTSADATRADAPPPKPLNAATSWGIAVICTLRAR